MSRTAPALSTVGRAYASGRVSALKPPSPINQHRLQERLASASPEVQAAYAAGAAADPALPLPEAGEVLGLVVARMAAEAAPDRPRGPLAVGAAAGATTADAAQNKPAHARVPAPAIRRIGPVSPQWMSLIFPRT